MNGISFHLSFYHIIIEDGLSFLAQGCHKNGNNITAFPYCSHLRISFIQKIPAETEHGRSLVTRMRVFEIRNDTDVSCSLSDPVFVKTVTDAYSSKLMLLKNKAYAVCIDVHNEVGFNRSSDVWPIIIRPEQQGKSVNNMFLF